MGINSINTTNFRNLNNNEPLEFSPRFNLISGKNASGKTSLLEAIYFLCVGKSFRSRKIDKIIFNESKQRSFVLYGEAKSQNLNYKIGIQREKSNRAVIKVNGGRIHSSSNLAKIIPITILDPNSLDLITGSAGERRKFLDWGVFHVEHGFASAWSKYIYCLKQRNSLLRSDKIDPAGLKIWSLELVKYADVIDNYRRDYITKIEPYLQRVFLKFGFNISLSIKYERGWDKKKDLQIVYNDQVENDRRKRHTQYGPHRADLKFEVNQQDAAEFLSRGQIKVLVSCLVLSQIELLYQEREKSVVLLIDDIGAELDSTNQRVLLECANRLETQIFCTSLDSGIKSSLEDIDDIAMFHVEHGEIKRTADLDPISQ